MTDRDAERRSIIRRLIHKLTANPEPSIQDYITVAANYTGLHPRVIRDLESNDNFETTIKPVDRSAIYAKLVYFYTIKNCIPTTNALFNSLYGEIPLYLDIGQFKKLLIKMGFVWKKVSATNCVVIEDPLVRFERYNYLKRIQLYRSTNTDVYYIDEGSYDSSGTFRDPKLTKKNVVNVQNDWMQRVIYAVGPDGVHAIAEIDDFTPDTVGEWITISLLPKISKPSVFILNNCEHHNKKLFETPTLDSLKSDMQQWLDRHDIEYDPKTSKYELFALAERCTDLTKHFYKIDEILLAHGHSVLRIPKSIEKLTTAAILARIVNSNLSDVISVDKTNGSITEAKILFREFITGVGLTYIEELEVSISKEEKKLIDMEDRVDQVYDGFLSDANNYKWSKDTDCEDSDLPSFSDSE